MLTMASALQLVFLSSGTVFTIMDHQQLSGALYITDELPEKELRDAKPWPPGDGVLGRRIDLRADPFTIHHSNRNWIPSLTFSTDQILEGVSAQGRRITSEPLTATSPFLSLILVQRTFAMEKGLKQPFIGQ
jgi:hypothetical protein